MSKFANKFFYLLSERDEDEVSALDATPQDDSDSFKGSVDDPANVDDFDQMTKSNVNRGEDIQVLKSWIDSIDKFKGYLNGSSDSILSKLRDEAVVGTIFDDVSDSMKTKILDIAEKLASLNEQLRSLYTEKGK